jgi:hypothetical protein
MLLLKFGEDWIFSDRGQIIEYVRDVGYFHLTFHADFSGLTIYTGLRLCYLLELLQR